MVRFLRITRPARRLRKRKVSDRSTTRGATGQRARAKTKTNRMNAILLAALMAVETGGERNPDRAIGDGGRAIGCLQIHRATVRDVNRIAGTRFTHDQMTNRQESIRVATIYLDHYASGLDDLSRARVWNGGPRGHLKSSTRAYARRIRKELDKQLVTINKTNRR